MRWRPYLEYKDSGIEWLGRIPENWNTQKLKFNSYIKGRIGWQNLRSDEFTDEGPYLVTGMHFKDGDVDWGACYHITEDRYSMAPEIFVREGDVLITKDGSIGKLAYISHLPGKASLNSHLLIIRPRRNTYDSRFLYHLLGSEIFQHFVLIVQKGTTFYGISQESVEDFSALLPTLPEQHAIAVFLDRETERIDSLIAKKERQIELLQEKRAALISHVVTKGLNPNVKMKDSGIEWLGEIPAHWITYPIKRVSIRIQTGCTPPTSEERYYEDGTVPWYGPGSFGTNLVLSEPVKLLNEAAIREGTARLFAADSIMVVCIGATIGKVGYLASPASSNQQITAITPNLMKASGKFLSYQLKRLEHVLREIAPSTTLPILDQQEVGYLPCALPSLREQHLIVEYLDRSLQKADTMTTKIHDSIAMLRQYRTALISAAVTGKIDVRKEVS